MEDVLCRIHELRKEIQNTRENINEVKKALRKMEIRQKRKLSSQHDDDDVDTDRRTRQRIELRQKELDLAQTECILQERLGYQEKRKLELFPTLDVKLISITTYPQLYLERLNHHLQSKLHIDCQLEERSITLPSALGNFSLLDDGAVMDLSFLDPLRLPGKEERFLPRKIFIRPCMKETFTYLCQNAGPVLLRQKKPSSSPTVLLSSPGVGSSILLFLVALYQAQHSNILYLRRTKNENYISVFMLLPDPSNPNTVRIWWTRKVVQYDLKRGLCDLWLGISDFRVDPNRRSPAAKLDTRDTSRLYTFVDGPRYSDEYNTIYRQYDYYCTTGGHSLPEYRGITNDPLFHVVALGGWTQDEAIRGLRALLNTRKRQALRAYALCGGNIRSMLRVCQSEVSYEMVKKETDALLSRLNPLRHEIPPRKESYDRPEKESGMTRLYTMFQGDKDSRAVTGHGIYQMIDSAYALQYLQGNP